MNQIKCYTKDSLKFTYVETLEMSLLVTKQSKDVNELMDLSGQFGNSKICFECFSNVLIVGEKINSESTEIRGKVLRKNVLLFCGLYLYYLQYMQY